MSRTPWKTSQDVIDSIKRKIMLPTNQSTFTDNEILLFADEEMMVSQVPSVLSYNAEYFVIFRLVPLQSTVSRYAIPNRAIGMRLRDLFYVDSSGNLFEMTQVNEHDRATYQRGSSGSVVYKFYIEGNDIVITPAVNTSVTGSLCFVFYLRPNQLVKTDRAATISQFKQTITVNNSFVQNGDTVTLDDDIYTAVTSSGGTITGISVASQSVITSISHNLTTGQTITISGSNCDPSINGTYVVTVVDQDTFTIPKEVGTAGTTGTFTCSNQFVIGATSAITATNLAGAISAVGNMNSSASSNIVTFGFSSFQATTTASRTVAFVIPSDTIIIDFDSLPSTYTDTETNITEDLFTETSFIDFLQTKPGHRTYLYDVEIPSSGISGTTITFDLDDLKYPATSSGTSFITMVLLDLQVGDYICLANESIIPQIPPDLHTDLVERAAARILFGLGDQQGLQNSAQRINEIDQKKDALISQRSEGTPQKISNRKSLVGFGKLGFFRRW